MASRPRPSGQVSKGPPSAPGDRPSPPSTPAAEAEILYRALVEQSLVGIYLISADRFLYVNQAMADLFGYTREEMMDALRWADTVHPADRDLAVEQVRIRLQGGTAGVRY